MAYAGKESILAHNKRNCLTPIDRRVFCDRDPFIFQGEISFREGYFDDAELRYALRI